MSRRTSASSWLLPIALFVAALTAMGSPNLGWAHPPELGGHSAQTSAQGIVATHHSPQLLLPAVDDAAPWSDAPVLNGANRFQFAVVTDRTGGHRPGIWMQAVRNLNLLRPEFVVSVGDLIEGYTDDVVQAEKEWDEFLGFIKQLEMRFFFVAGNHDVTNPMLHDLWRKHFGREWYSFSYKDVHFLCLLSEDPTSQISDKQLEWALDDLKQHQQARWTFVFIHKPLWVYSERNLAAGETDATNWKPIETALTDRPHTVFAGHVHHYVQYKRNGREYYSLATTGGGSRLRGQAYGEFDQITWVTMEDDGPHIANILLDGVLAADVVTEESIETFRRFLDETQIRIEPVLVDSGNTLQDADLKIQITNGFDDAVLVDAFLQGVPLKGLSVDPESLTARIESGETKQATVRFQLEQQLEFAQLRNVSLVARLKTDDSSPLTAELTIPVAIDRRHHSTKNTITVDGSIDEWNGEPEQMAEQSATFGASQQWQGPGDGTVEFQVAHDDENLYVGGRVSDDVVIAGRDKLFIALDARDAQARLTDPRLNDHAYTLELQPSFDEQQKSSSTATLRTRRGRRDGTLTAEQAVRKTNDGYTFELAIPIRLLHNAQDSSWQSFQMNVVMLDIDEASDKDVYVLWRPAIDLRNTNTNYGYFFREKPTKSE